MPWVRLDTESKWVKRRLEGTEGTTKFIADNNVDLDVLFDYLDGLRLSCRDLDYETRGKSDIDVLAEAWEKNRVLLTHDDGFLNRERHPPETNPGIVVMPGGSGDLEQFLPVIGKMLNFMKPNRRLWLGTYVKIGRDGIISIEGVNATTKERIPTWHMRFDEDGLPLTWDDDEVGSDMPA